MTINYYDDYVFKAFTPAIAYTAPVAYNNSTLKPKGLATGSWTRVLKTLAYTIGESSYILYDAKARPVKTFSVNHLGGSTQIDNTLNTFSGQLMATETSHKRLDGDAILYLKDTYVYTAQDRLDIHTHKIGTGDVPQLLVKNEYDELGQLIVKKVGGTNITGASYLQKVDYTYNIRGWLTSINNDATNNLVLNTTEKDLFGFKINYNKVEQSTAAAKSLYNGNIAETAWITGSDRSGIVRWYGYKYDQLNRLKDATYQTPSLTNNKNYFGENMDYDPNGNIIRLQRKFMAGVLSDPYDGDMDNLSYFYDANSNQLKKVTDASNEAQGFKDDSNGYNDISDDYAYDANGNLTKDDNKGITLMTYNHLNLPTKITFGTAGTIEYIYNAAGQKLEKIVTQGTTITSTNYLGGFQYTKPHLGTWALQFFPTAEGYVKNTVVSGANTYSYVFNYTDHLGNVRLSYSDADKNGVIVSSEILDESHYYPFGLKHVGYNDRPATDYKYKYNGKELQDELGLNMYDYHARNYDPAIGRWMNVDPLAETSKRFSPYTYALNNPVFFIDPDGMQATYNWAEHDKGNKGVYTDGDKNVSFETALAQANGGDASPDNGYDENGKQINNNGGDKTDYIYNKDGGVVSSTSVKFKGAIPSSSPLRGYGFKGFAMASGGINEDNTIANFFTGGIIAKYFIGKLAASAVGVEGAVWAQKTFSGTFSAGGKFAGQTVDEVAGSLRSGALSAADVPINVVVRNGQTFILNTRSSAALMQGGIPRSAWNVVNQTGVSSFESMLSGQLARNALINGTNTIRQSGTQIILSN